jgi:hypothetical protein
MRKCFLWFFLLLPFLFACVNSKKVTYFADLKDSTAFSSLTIPEHIIQPNDLLSINVSSLDPTASEMFNKPNQNQMRTTTNNGDAVEPAGYLVNKAGFINFLMIGNIKAEGLTKDQLQENIRRAIVERKLLLDPVIEVRHLNYKVTVLPEEQAAFIKKSLGPIFKSNNIKTKIIIYDHNADRPDYPITILNDAEARQYIDGSAFHLYGGKIEALQQVHTAHPDKHLYFTEQWIGAPGNFPQDLKWHTANLTIGATRNWCRTVLEWNLTNNPTLTPFTDRGGCSKCLGAVTIDGNKVTRNPAYYIIAHASKFVRPGAERIFSNSMAPLLNVAFKTSTGKTVLLVLNEGNDSQTFHVKSGNQTFRANLEGGAVATYVW